MPIPTTLLGGLTPEAFLRDYWQQKPLLVRGALPGFTSPLTQDELAGLACEDDGMLTMNSFTSWRESSLSTSKTGRCHCIPARDSSCRVGSGTGHAPRSAA